MKLVRLSEIDASMIDLVGGKAANLGELIRAGERVPDGFCVTTAAYRAGELPEAEIHAAYRELGEVPVAVRSSATAEDLPEASFAGQQDTFLHVRGGTEVVRAVRDCWDSLYTERAVAYRRAREVEDESAHMAVVIQRMVEPVAAGVLFTANPMTGCRTETVIDATPGLGSGVVDGSVVPDHYVLPESAPLPEAHGCLDPGQLTELRRAGERLERYFGAPQDIEWAIDADGVLWLLQARPITTLFPPPPDRDGMRLYLEFGHLQGMVQPFTPMGMSVLRTVTEEWLVSFGFSEEAARDLPTDIGGRWYMDMTDFLRSARMRKRLPAAMRIYGPRTVSAVQAALADPRFAPRPGLPIRPAPVLWTLLRGAPKAIAGVLRVLAYPDAARQRTFDTTATRNYRAYSPSSEADPEQLLRSAIDAQRTFTGPEMSRLMWPVATGILVSRLAGAVLAPVADEAEMNTVLGGLPHNVTTEMDLALWRLARDAWPHRELLLSTPPEALSRMYREGALPDIGLDGFLAEYGMRAAGEVDVGVPRWSEDPAPLFATIANYLRLTDAEQAPDQRFHRASTVAEAKITELVRRARRHGVVRARLAAFFLRRTRQLAGLREFGKFAWLHALARTRELLLRAGSDLARRGVLNEAEDIMFLDLAEAHAASRGVDHRPLVATRKAVYARESRRSRVPSALLSDGTDLDAAMSSGRSAEGAMAGWGAAPGKVTARARVVRDPSGAHLEPGEILVAPSTDPGWTPLFLTAAGLVTDTGAPMAHGPTVAREYGIPAVICVPDATREITTGQLITIDGAAGTVLPHSDED